MKNSFDRVKGEIIDETPIVKRIKKKEASVVLYEIWENVTETNIIEAFDEAICKYFNDIPEDPKFSEDADFDLKIAQLIIGDLNTQQQVIIIADQLSKKQKRQKKQLQPPPYIPNIKTLPQYQLQLQQNAYHTTLTPTSDTNPTTTNPTSIQHIHSIQEPIMPLGKETEERFKFEDISVDELYEKLKPYQGMPGLYEGINLRRRVLLILKEYQTLKELKFDMETSQ